MALKRVFFDTNILLDVLLERAPYCHAAQVLWTQSENKKIAGAISALSLSNVFFILERLSSSDRAYQGIQALFEIFHVVDVTSSLISKALGARFKDFEDAIQYFSAQRYRAHVILTRDADGFVDSKIPVMDCNEYLGLA